MWLAQVGRERIEETIDPELSIDRALETYVKLGYDADWINQRLQTIRARKELTDQWKSHGVEQGKEFAILTDEVTRAWSGMSTRQYKNLKGLKKENLRDNMSTLEHILFYSYDDVYCIDFECVETDDGMIVEYIGDAKIVPEEYADYLRSLIK